MLQSSQFDGVAFDPFSFQKGVTARGRDRQRSNGVNQCRTFKRWRSS